MDSLEKVLSGQVDKRDAGDRVAQSRSIDLVADQLVKAYQQVLRCNMRIGLFTDTYFPKFRVLRPVFEPLKQN